MPCNCAPERFQSANFAGGAMNMTQRKTFSIVARSTFSLHWLASADDQENAATIRA